MVFMYILSTNLVNIDFGFRFCLICVIFLKLSHVSSSILSAVVFKSSSMLIARPTILQSMKIWNWNFQEPKIVNC